VPSVWRHLLTTCHDRRRIPYSEAQFWLRPDQCCVLEQSHRWITTLTAFLQKVSCSFLYGPRSACHYLPLFYFATISYWENILCAAWLVVADVSEIHSLHLTFLHWVLTSGNVMGGNISEKYFASIFRVSFLFCVYSSSVALQPNLGLGLFNPPSPGISILC
jgi:hypothetical protein